MTLPENADALPVHNLDALRSEITTLLAFKVKALDIKAMLLRQAAPPSAWIEAMVVMAQPTSPMRVARALCEAATRTDLLPGIPAACRRWGVHPASLVALWTRGPLGLGLALGLPEGLIRSFPSKRRRHEENGHWSPPRDFLGPVLPESMVLQELRLCEQPRLLRLPDRLHVAKRITLDRLLLLADYGPALTGFEGSLGIRDCPALPPLPALPRLLSLTVDGQLWTRFPEAPLEVRQTIALQRMSELEVLDPAMAARKLILAHCPRLREIPHLPQVALPPEGPLRTRLAILLDPWIPDLVSTPHGLTLVGCHGVRDLPAGYRVHGTLTLQDCWSFEALPPDLEVGNLVLRRLPALRHLPEGLRVKGHLILDGLANLEALPKDLRVAGDLIVHQMPPRALALPDDLRVGGQLKVHPSDAALPWPDRPRAFPPLGQYDAM